MKPRFISVFIFWFDSLLFHYYFMRLVLFSIVSFEVKLESKLLVFHNFSKFRKLKTTIHVLSSVPMPPVTELTESATCGGNIRRMKALLTSTADSLLKKIP